MSRITRSGNTVLSSEMDIIQPKEISSRGKRAFGRDITNITNQATENNLFSKEITKPHVFKTLDADIASNQLQSNGDFSEDARGYMRRPAGEWRCNLVMSPGPCMIYQ